MEGFLRTTKSKWPLISCAQRLRSSSSNSTESVSKSLVLLGSWGELSVQETKRLMPLKLNELALRASTLAAMLHTNPRLAFHRAEVKQLGTGFAMSVEGQTTLQAT